MNCTLNRNIHATKCSHINSNNFRTLNSSSEIINRLETFLSSLKSDYNILSKIITNFELTLNIIVFKEDLCDLRCTALVENINGQKYRCTRKKKFGSVCGLHHKRKNSFKSIQSSNDIKTYSLSLNMNNSTNINRIDNQYKENSIQDEFRDIKWKGIYYILHVSTGNVYNCDTEELLGHINSTNIPIYYSF